MSRELKRVPKYFAWPLSKIWGGFVNPYYAQSTTCPNCDHGYDRAGGRPDANAALFRAQWYGNAPFDPAAYGAEPLSIDHPAIRTRAERNVATEPNYYMTDEERRKRTTFRRALARYRGDCVIYVGESHGCTATDAFHEALETEWNLVEEHDIPQWSGLHDAVYIYARRVSEPGCEVRADLERCGK